MSLNLESPLSTISRNCKKDLIAIGGKSMMKVIQLHENNEMKVHRVLKTAKSSSKAGTTDLAWNNFYENYLASTTLIESKVLLWDINQVNLNKMSEKIGSHTQMINRINWNNKNPDLLASCSQDGLLNIWNIKNKPDQFVISMNHKEKIRDCQFSPFSEHEILASYVSGMIKLWDTRNYKTSVKEFLHHETDVLTIDWHPEVKNLFCSGSMDKNLFIWDVSQSEPIQSYKTSHGTSRVKWWKKNPQYIISSYQTNNFYASMWNINIDNMPEYTYKGHKDVVTGFCWDVSETRLISCSKDNYLIVNNFSDGLRCLDNLSTHFNKFADDDIIYHYSDTKPPKTDFNNVNFSRLLTRDKVKKRFQIKTSDTSLISLSTKLQNNHYYTFNKKQIEDVFTNYSFLTNNLIFIQESPESKFLSKSSKIKSLIQNNFRYARDNFKNYIHFSVWNQLKFLSELDSFLFLDKIVNDIPENNFSMKDEMMLEIFRSNITEIINFLIDCHADLWLATIIIFIFHEVFPLNKDKYLRIVEECIENLRKNKLYKISAKLMKFGIYDEVKKNKQNSLFILGCRKCGLGYDPFSFMGLCGNCKVKIKCQICLLPMNGLFTWCSTCCHGGHPDHLNFWFKSNGFCPSGCGHRCR